MYCPETFCTNFPLHNPCWLVNILSKVCFQRWKFTNTEIWRQHDVTGSKEYLTFYLWNSCFLLNIQWKFYENLNIFHGDIKQNASGCFFLNTVYYRYVYVCGCQSVSCRTWKALAYRFLSKRSKTRKTINKKR